MEPKTICMIGGTGFVGIHLANRLGAAGYRVRVLVRRRQLGRDLLVVPTLRLIEADVHDERELVRHFDGCHAVVNLAGILNELGGPPGDAFRHVHVDLPRRIVSACRRAGVPRYLHMSALGADPDGPSLYQQTKGEGERAVLEADPARVAVTAFRPSVIFGPGDNFLNRFATLLKLSPGLFFLPTPEARFQPVYVGDVAGAFMRGLDDASTRGQSIELCGPQVYTLRDLVEYVAELRGLRRRVIGLSDRMSQLQGRIFQRLPGRPYTLDNYRSATVPNCCSEDGLARLGIVPTPLEAVAPTYLGFAGRQDHYQDSRRTAGR